MFAAIIMPVQLEAVKEDEDEVNINTGLIGRTANFANPILNQASLDSLNSLRTLLT